MIKILGHEHLTPSEQPEVLGRSLEALDGALEVLEDDFRSTRAYNTRLRRARGLVRPGPTGLCTPHRYEEDSGYTQGSIKIVILLGLYFVILLGLLPCKPTRIPPLDYIKEGRVPRSV